MLSNYWDYYKWIKPYRAVSVLFLLFQTPLAIPCEQNLSTLELDAIAQRIYLNECNGQSACLVDWNPGETFPSLGIGHFIWYPARIDPGYVESFPLLVDYIRRRSIALPRWLAQLDPLDAPWSDRASFMKQRHHTNVEQLRSFLLQNQTVQIEFMQQRMQQSLDKIIARTEAAKRNQVRKNIELLCASVQGQYALTDYVNFKGEGLAKQERTNGVGWGLMQVLSGMPLSQSATDAVTHFSESAVVVLTHRATNATSPLELTQWLPGWRKRIQTYSTFSAP